MRVIFSAFTVNTSTVKMKDVKIHGISNICQNMTSVAKQVVVLVECTHGFCIYI